MLMTTLTAIRAAKPCPDGYARAAAHLGGVRKFGAKTEFPVASILDSNGISDTCWVLDEVCGDTGWMILGLWAADCAERVLPRFESFVKNDDRPRNAIAVLRRRILGDASQEELSAARSAAESAAAESAAARSAAARSAVWSAAAAGSAARSAAARSAVWSAAAAEEKWQADRLRAYLNGEIELPARKVAA